jgi:hypothetical protein
MLTAVYHFEISGLWVKAELLGTRHETTFSNHELALILPRKAGDFGIGKSGDPLLRCLGSYTNDAASGEKVAAEVLVVRVEVEVESDLKGSPDPYTKPENDVINQGIIILQNTVGIARSFVRRYAALVRAELDQYWLGSSESEPKAIWVSSLFDGDGYLIPVGYSEAFCVSWRPLDRALGPSVNLRLIDAASREITPDLANTFLRDAEYAAFEAVHSNLRQAVMLAAIACEIKVKDVITALASEEQEPLVNLLLENPRDWTMAAASLFDKGMAAVCGRSLRVEDKSLFKEVEKIFQDRNKIAHKGGTKVSLDDVLKKHVTSAKAAFAWLDGVQSDCL